MVHQETYGARFIANSLEKALRILIDLIEKEKGEKSPIS